LCTVLVNSYVEFCLEGSKIDTALMDIISLSCKKQFAFDCVMFGKGIGLGFII